MNVPGEVARVSDRVGVGAGTFGDNLRPESSIRRGNRHALVAVLPMPAVAAGFLRLVKRFVGAADDPGHVVAGFELRHAQAARDFERLVLVGGN